MRQENMKKIFLLFIACSLFCPVPSKALDIPEALRAEAEKAMADGASLYRACLKGPVADETIVKEKTKIDDFCDFRYNAYLANGDVYFIAEPPTAGGIVFGRHYRVLENKVVKSTITCFAPPEPPKDAVGAYTTHLLSDTPSEFHVFLSLKYKKLVYVGTKAGTWKVEGGKIEFIEKRE